MSSYCTRADVNGWIPPQAVRNPSRLLGSVAAGTDIISLDNHGLSDDDAVTFRAESGGTLPGGIVAGTTYYVLRQTDSTFKVSATEGGSAVDITSAGTNVVMVTELPWDNWIEQASNEIECTLPSAAVPLSSPYPAVVTDYCAGLVAERALVACGVGAPPGFSERMDRVRYELREWRKNGIVIRGAAQPTASNCAVTSSATAADARGWADRGDGVIP